MFNMFKKKTPEEEARIREIKELRKLMKQLKRKKSIKLISIFVNKDGDEM